MTTLRRQLGLFKWLIPAGLMLLVIVYELGPARWLNDGLGFSYHLLVEIVLFGTLGPALAFVLLDLLGRWVDEKETADLQAKLLAEANEKEIIVRQVSDDTLQVLFATSLLIATMKSDHFDLPSETAAQIEATEQELQEAIDRLRFHLLS
jgi:signal transduction histidine kinase